MIADKDFILDAFNPGFIQQGIAERMRERRLELNLTQNGLASKAGISLGTLKRFENSYEISLKYLLMIAVVMDATEEFEKLFTKKQFEDIEEVLKISNGKKRQRGRKNA